MLILDSGKCAPQEEINKVLNNCMANSYFCDSYIDSNDYLKPNKKNIRSDSITLTNQEYCM
jgi:hypothetical protein